MNIEIKEISWLGDRTIITVIIPDVSQKVISPGDYKLLFADNSIDIFIEGEALVKYSDLDKAKASQRSIVVKSRIENKIRALLLKIGNVNVIPND